MTGSEYETVDLGDVAEFLDSRRRPVKAADRVPGPFPYYGANGQQGTIDDFIFNEPLVLLAEDGGHFDSPDRGIAYRIGGKTWVNNHAHVLRPGPDITWSYLCRVLENRDVTQHLTGSTRAKLTQGGARRIQIPLPPLPEQKRIAAILDAADALRAKRRESLEHLDALVQSVFLEMFGDPVTNPKGWETVAFDAIGKFNSGSTPRKSREDYWNGDVPWVSPKDMKVPVIHDSQDHVSELAFEETALRLVPPDCLLIVVRGMILAHSFPVARNAVAVSINQDMKAIEPNQPLAIEFTIQCLELLKRRIIAEVSAAGHGTRRFDAEAMRRIEVPLPPAGLQERFSELAERVNAQRLRLKAHLTELDTLFASLQSRAFRGEL